MKKIFFPTYSVLERSAHHLILAISVELPIYHIYTALVPYLSFKISNIFFKFRLSHFLQNSSYFPQISFKWTFSFFLKLPQNLDLFRLHNNFLLYFTIFSFSPSNFLKLPIKFFSLSRIFTRYFLHRFKIKWRAVKVDSIVSKAFAFRKSMC